MRILRYPSITEQQFTGCVTAFVDTLSGELNAATIALRRLEGRAKGSAFAYEMTLDTHRYGALIVLDRWGSLSVEALLNARPEFVVITRYRMNEASLANAFFAHPALEDFGAQQKTLAIDARQVACGAPASLAAAETLVEQMAAL